MVLRVVARACNRGAVSMAAPKVPRRPLGKTGLDVSVLGFGASPLGGVFQVGAAMLQRGRDATMGLWK